MSAADGSGDGSRPLAGGNDGESMKRERKVKWPQQSQRLAKAAGAEGECWGMVHRGPADPPLAQTAPCLSPLIALACAGMRIYYHLFISAWRALKDFGLWFM